jgi:dTDP-4-amino-4,6-dideoxygalactose transaminase
MKVKYFDLKKVNHKILQTNKEEILKQIFSGQYILPTIINKFENNFLKFCRSKYCVTVNSGHDALKFALIACGVKRGDNVAVPAMTFISTWFAVSEIGANPICVDIDIQTGLMSNEKLKNLINNKKINCVIFVHLFGNICNINEIKYFLKKKKILIIEDCAQSHGGFYKNTHTGNFGDIGTFSFYPGKNLGGIGDGGAIITKNKKIYENIIKLRNYGTKMKYVHETLGFNSRLNHINAIFLKFKLKKLNQDILSRSIQIQKYKKEFNKFHHDIKFMEVQKNVMPSNHIFYIRTKFRNQLVNFLNESQIETLIHYPIIPPLQKFYKNKYSIQKKNFKNALILSKEILSLPIGDHLNSKDIKYITKQINFFYKKIKYKFS